MLGDFPAPSFRICTVQVVLFTERSASTGDISYPSLANPGLTVQLMEIAEVFKFAVVRMKPTAVDAAVRRYAEMAAKYWRDGGVLLERQAVAAARPV